MRPALLWVALLAALAAAASGAGDKLRVSVSVNSLRLVVPVAGSDTVGALVASVDRCGRKEGGGWLLLLGFFPPLALRVPALWVAVGARDGWMR